MLKINNLTASIDGKQILKGISLDINEGETVGIMGPNGSGKSTLSNVLMGNESFNITGDITYEGEKINEIPTDERSKRGIFLSFQNPTSIPGLKVNHFLKTIMKAHKGKIRYKEFKEKVSSCMKMLDIPDSVLDRYLNEGFSGGEKKKLEMLQMLLLDPKLSILDETDSGLDIDALNIVADAINRRKNGKNSFLVITHYSRILKLIQPDKVYVLSDGRIVHEGDKTLPDELEKKGYDWIKE